MNKDNIGKLFDRIARHYDMLNHLLSFGIDRRWRRQAVRTIENKVDNLLDVAIGTADLSIAILKRGKAEHIVGIDLSEEMLSIGRHKINKKGYGDKVEMMQADCSQLPFDDNRFGCVTCSYGVRNFAHLDECIAEMYRVLQPGGQLMILEFAYPRRKFFRVIYDFYFTKILPLVGGLISHDKAAYAYLPASVKNFCSGELFLSHLSRAGFKECNYKSQTFGISMIYTAWKK